MSLNGNISKTNVAERERERESERERERERLFIVKKRE